MSQRNRNTSGGSVQLKPSIINDVHKLVNLHRKEIGLKPFVFKKKNRKKVIDPLKFLILGEDMNDNEDKVVKVERPSEWPAPPPATYTLAEINDAIRFNNGGSIRIPIKAGDVKVKCSCNCGGYVPVTLAMQGWKFIRGHKNTARLNGNGFLKNGSSHAKPVVASEVYESYASRIAMDIAQVSHEMLEVKQQAEILTFRLKKLKEKYDQLKLAENALKPLFTKDVAQGVGA